MPADPVFSLILATLGRTEPLGRLFGTLACQTVLDFEIIVVDQNGDDRLLPWLERARYLGLRIRHLRESRRGLSHARNVGLQQARGQWLAFPDDDCWYEPDVLAQVLRTIERDTALEGVVGRWVEEDPQGLRAPHKVAWEVWRRMRGGDASSICLFLSRSRVEEVGRFDPRLGVGRWYGAGEETDLLLRILAQGARIEFNPAVRVHHRLAEPPQRLDGQALAQARSRARGTGALYRKHRLDPWVIARGLAAPLVKGVFSRRPHVTLTHGACVSMGRLEGLLRWNGSGSDVKPPGATA